MMDPDNSLSVLKKDSSLGLSKGEKQVDSGLSLQSERKLRRQAKNKLKKENDKRGREEELRRKLCEPKDQRVRLVNQKELEFLMKGQQCDSGSTSTYFIPTSEEFPSLGKVTKDKQRKIVVRPVDLSFQGRNTLSSTRPRPDEAELLSPEPSTCCEKIRETFQSSTTPNCETKAVPGIGLTKNQSVKPKRNDPIQIDLITALKKSENVVVPERKSVSKKDIPPRLTGNQLDSSKPERKKGKVREIPKEKKPTHLKRIIIKEREDRKLAKQNCDLADLIRPAIKIDSSFGRNSSKSESTDEVVTYLECSENSKEIPCKLTILNDQKEQLDVPEFSLHIHEKSVEPLNSEERFSKQIIYPTEDGTGHVNIDFIGARGDVVGTQDASVESVKISLHSRKFREYCDHSLSRELDTVVSALIKDIVKFQDRLYFSDPVKAHAKRRFVLGFREVKKYLSFKKIKLLIIAPDLERVQSKGGIDEIIEILKMEASIQEVPCVFAIGRRGLKKLTNKSHNVQGVSCIGVLSYEGSEVNFQAITSILPALRAQFAEKLENAKSFLNEGQQTKVGITETNNVPLLVDATASKVQPVDVNTEVVASFLSKLVKELGKD